MKFRFVNREEAEPGVKIRVETQKEKKKKQYTTLKLGGKSNLHSKLKKCALYLKNQWPMVNLSKTQNARMGIAQLVLKLQGSRFKSW